MADILRRAIFVRHHVETFFQRQLCVWFRCKHWLPWWRGEILGLSFEKDLRLGDVGVSDNLVR